MIRQLEYLVALAREKHFARAAESCGVAQPTLSTALRQLEEELSTAIVNRGNRFCGFTPEGEVVLLWARRILADQRSLRQDVVASRGPLSGSLRLGVIPTANAIVPQLTTSFVREHPRVVIEWIEMRFEEGLRDLMSFELDGAITYIDKEPLQHVRALPISRERWVLAAPENSPSAQLEAVTWAEAAMHPLCVLHPDARSEPSFGFDPSGVAPGARVQVHSMMAMLCCLQSGYWSSILPQSLTHWLEGVRGMRVVPLVAPEIVDTVGLVIADRKPVPALIRAFWEHVERLDAPEASTLRNSSVIGLQQLAAAAVGIVAPKRPKRNAIGLLFEKKSSKRGVP